MTSNAIRGAAEILASASRVLFVTGAGISADSGLPTYRGIGGLYNRETDDGVPIEVALSGDMFERNPALTWKYIRQIEEACRGASHNAAHTTIAQMESRYDVCTLTQNVDGFHRRAGSTNVIDIHGDIHDLVCTACPYRQTVDDYTGLEELPGCPECHSVIRPDVVLFGEMLPQAKVLRLGAELERGFDAVFSIGTTSVFPYIAQPVVDAQLRGVPTVEINPGVTEVSDLVDVKLPARAVEACPAIWRMVQGWSDR